MNKFFKSAVAGALAISASFALGAGNAAKADVDYPYAGTAFLSVGGQWRSIDNCLGPACDNEVLNIVGGGDFVLPQTGYWNLQLGGAVSTWHEHPDFGPPVSTRTHFQGGAIGFWRNPETGVFGLELGIFSPARRNRTRLKVGGVGQYFFSDNITLAAFGGALIPFDDSPTRRIGLDTGFYAGGEATYYLSDNAAFAAYANYRQGERTIGNGPGQTRVTRKDLRVGGKARYLTSIPGLEVFGTAGYISCERDEVRRGRGFGFASEGAEAHVGFAIHLGGHNGSLVAIDRSNSLDTRVWGCGPVREIP